MMGGTWLAQTLSKPQIAQKALADFPDRPVIFMDADCTVHGDLSPLVSETCDVALRDGSMAGSESLFRIHARDDVMRNLV